MAPLPEAEIMTVKRLEVALKNGDYKLLKDGAYKLHEKYHSGHRFEYIESLEEILLEVETNPSIPNEIKDILSMTIKDILADNNSFAPQEEQPLTEQRVSTLTSLSYNAPIENKEETQEFQMEIQEDIKEEQTPLSGYARENQAPKANAFDVFGSSENQNQNQFDIPKQYFVNSPFSAKPFTEFRPEPLTFEKPQEEQAPVYETEISDEYAEIQDIPKVDNEIMQEISTFNEEKQEEIEQIQEVEEVQEENTQEIPQFGINPIDNTVEGMEEVVVEKILDENEKEIPEYLNQTQAHKEPEVEIYTPQEQTTFNFENEEEKPTEEEIQEEVEYLEESTEEAVEEPIEELNKESIQEPIEEEAEEIVEEIQEVFEETTEDDLAGFIESEDETSDVEDEAIEERSVAIVYGQDNTVEKNKNIKKLRKLIANSFEEEASISEILKLISEVSIQSNINVMELQSILKQIAKKEKTTHLITNCQSAMIAHLLNQLNIEFKIDDTNAKVNLLPLLGLSNLFVCQNCSETHLTTNEAPRPLVLECPKCKGVMYPEFYVANEKPELNIDYYNNALVNLANSKVWLLINPSYNDKISSNLIESALRVSSSVEEVYILEKDYNVREAYKNIFAQIKPEIRVHVQNNILENFFNIL